MTNPFPMWVIYDRPSDYPDGYIAREFLIKPGGAIPTSSTITSDSLLRLRETFLVDMGLSRLDRSPEDDPVIVETWL